MAHSVNGFDTAENARDSSGTATITTAVAQTGSASVNA